MSARVARRPTREDHDLLGDYIDFCQQLGVSDRSMRDRLRAARSFLGTHPDLQVWMERPVSARLAELRRLPAWSLLGWAMLTGHVKADLDLLLLKDFGTLGATAEALFPEDFELARQGARRLLWTPDWTRSVLREGLVLTLAATGLSMRQLLQEDLDELRAAIDASPLLTPSARRRRKGQLFGVAQLLFECRLLPAPPRRPYPAAATPAERFSALPETELRAAMVRYVEVRSAVLARKSVDSLINDLLPFGEFLAGQQPEIVSLRQLDRGHIEAFLVYNRIRTWRGRKTRDKQVAPTVVHAAVLSLRNFLDDITLWGWAERPPRQLLFATDVPRLPRPLPRALAPNDDTALMAAAAQLEDRFARCALVVLRYAGLRIGELLDLELDAIVDYGPAGTWLRVPLGKLKNERSVPLDHATVTTLDEWATARGQQRALPHPQTGTPTDFLFIEHGRRLGPWRIRSGLTRSAEAAGLRGPDGQAMRVTPHRLRHTYATTLANAGMSLQALMALLGHVTPEMTLRYATLASPTLRVAYDEAMTKAKPRLPLVPTTPVQVPTKVAWLHSEMLKTRVAHGYCSRHLAAEACPYANICEQCDNFVPAPEAADVLAAQLTDVRALHADAQARGWTSEADRHTRVASRLELHLATLDRQQPHGTSA